MSRRSSNLLWSFVATVFLTGILSFSQGLGLTRMHKSVELNDTAPIRGMIRKVSHLVKVEPVV